MPGFEETSTREWDRQPGEPILWYERFEEFRLMGAKRSVFAVYVRYRRLKAGDPKLKVKPTIPGAWTRARREWRWDERAAAWDKLESERRREEAEEERLRHREIRRAMTTNALNKVYAGLDHLKPEDLKWGEFIGALRALLHDLRDEYDDHPANRHQITGGDGKDLKIQVEWVDNAPKDGAAPKPE